MPNTKNHSVDKIKGIGILAVIFIHLPFEDVNTNYWHYINFSFANQLFFFISGWLTNTEKLITIPFKDFLLKVGKRMMFWWFVAWVVYETLYFGTHFDEFSIGTLLRHFMIPFYHLWFIPGLFATRLIYWMLARYTKLSTLQLSMLFLGLGFIVLICLNSQYIPDNLIIRRFNILFFAVGIIARYVNVESLLNEWQLGLVYVLFATFIFVMIKELTGIYTLPLVAFLFFVFLAPLLRDDALSQNVELEWLGRNSLQIYLWHYLPVLVLKQLFKDNFTVYVCVSVCVLLTSYLTLRVYLRKHMLDVN